MLLPDPTQRISAEDALNHPFFYNDFEEYLNPNKIKKIQFQN